MKHLHMLMAVLLIALFLYQSYVVLRSNKQPPFAIKISTHILYAVIILSGAGLLVQLMSANAPVQWVFAKVILLVAALSASIKAFNPSAAPSQRKTGILITGIAYVGILILAFTKPGNLF
ncbi:MULTISPECIES: SirB2 family protein [unclassified Psychrobacter]|uniref:SirB2 family protein n=1 Tax=unclassified Psychrobacter TaxID=196806 RepID=UPI002600BDF9|nr:MULTISPECIES: SirB2 family protein [unclassified Psychrobacter]